MQILFCNYEYPPLGGGGGVVMAAVAAELARIGHDVTVLTSRAMGLPALAVENGVQVVRVPVFFRRQQAVANLPSMAAYLPMAFWRGLRLGRRKPFDVINTHFVVPTGPVGQALAQRLAIPNVLSVHGGDLFDPSKPTSPHRHALLRSAVASLLRRADAVVAQSRDTARNVREIYGVQRQIEMIPLGIPRPPANVADRAALGLPADAFVLVTVGRMVARKATTQLAHVMASAQCPDWHLVIVGDGPDAAQMRSVAQSLDISERVHLLGHVSDAVKYTALASADVFVSTSQHEGFGLVFLEAMAFGLPIVCYDRGGQTDFLSTPTTGRVVRLNDIQAFTSAILELYRSRDERERISRHNIAAVETFFIDRCARRYEAVFEQAILTRSASLAAAKHR